MPEIIYTGRNVQRVLPEDVVKAWSGWFGTRINYRSDAVYPSCSANPAIKDSSGVIATDIEFGVHMYDENYPMNPQK